MDPWDLTDNQHRRENDMKNSKPKATKKDNRLCVLSATQWGESLHYSALGYGDGKIRTYLPGRLDGRIEGLKKVTRLRDLARHVIGKNSEEPVVAKVQHVQELTGWSNRRFAEAA
jgi:hypothetical protein